jgi:HK97 gp10 family phage protein
MDTYVAVDTGKLRSENDYKVDGKKVILINECDYAGYQEFGTYKMKAHPFMRPAVYNHIGEIQRITAGSYRNGIT